MSLSVDVVFISSSLTRYFRFSFRFRFFRFFLRFNFLMISQIAYFLHDAGCQQLQPCLCHFLCVYACVWVSLDTHTHRENSDRNNDDNNEVLQLCWGHTGCCFFSSSCSKVSTHAREAAGKAVAMGYGEGSGGEGTQAWSNVAYLYWHVQVDFLWPENVCAIHTLSRQTERQSERERQEETGCMCVCRLSKGSKTVDITMIIRLISYISYMCMHEYQCVCVCVSVNVSKRAWVCVCAACCLLLARLISSSSWRTAAERANWAGARKYATLFDRALLYWQLQPEPLDGKQCNDISSSALHTAS